MLSRARLRRHNRNYFAVMGYLHVIGPSYVLDISTGTGLSTGSVYPILAAAEHEGEVTSYWVHDNIGQDRKVYQIGPHA